MEAKSKVFEAGQLIAIGPQEVNTWSGKNTLKMVPG
jgi:hypothetical protein